jgi:hypothetical protein
MGTETERKATPNSDTFWDHDPAADPTPTEEPSGPKLVYSEGASPRASESIDPPQGEPMPPIAKPKKFSLARFKSDAPLLPGVSGMVAAIPILKLGEVGDYFRLHPDETAYWTDELYLVNVPVKGMKKDMLHLIDKNIATKWLEPKKILRFRLALATKPYGIFFWARVPTTNLDNSWNESAFRAAHEAKEKWIEVFSRKEEGYDDYRWKPAIDQTAFPSPKWPVQPQEDLLEPTFAGKMIETEQDPALYRLIGKKIENT